MPLPVPPGPHVAPPTSIAADCSTDVSADLRAWFKSLLAEQTVVMAPGACYLVNEGIKLKNPQGLTVYGGTFRTAATPTGPIAGQKGLAVFTSIGGSHLTLEEMQIIGANPGGYHPRLAFAGGINLEGTATATIRSVNIKNTFGDGISLSPLRGGANHRSGTIIAPASAIAIQDVTIDGIGRQGITFASVSGAQVSDVIVTNPGLNTFDLEADQWNEGTSDVTIDACRASGGVGFFANGGAGNAAQTHDITVENCTMTTAEGGSAILVQRANGRGTSGQRKLRGPFTFTSDSLKCGASVYVACVQLTGAEVTVSRSRLQFPSGAFHEAVYRLAGGSHATFVDAVVKGYGRIGSVSRNSSVRVTGGRWVAA